VKKKFIKRGSIRKSLSNRKSFTKIVKIIKGRRVVIIKRKYTFKKRIRIIKAYIRAILELKFNKKYKFKIIQAPHLYSDVKLITDFTQIKLNENPRQHRNIFNKVISGFIAQKQDAFFPSSNTSKHLSVNTQPTLKSTLLYLIKAYLFHTMNKYNNISLPKSKYSSRAQQCINIALNKSDFYLPAEDKSSTSSTFNKHTANSRKGFK